MSIIFRNIYYLTNSSLTIKLCFDLSVYYVASRVSKLIVHIWKWKRAKCGIVPLALFLFVLDTTPHHPLTISRLTALTMASINYHKRKLVQRTLLILSRDNNYSLFLGRSGGNRFFSPLTGHFVDRARDPSFIRAETIILYVHWPQGGRYTCLVVI